MLTGTNPLTDDRVETLCSTLALEPLQQLADRLARVPSSKRSSMLSVGTAHLPATQLHTQCDEPMRRTV